MNKLMIAALAALALTGCYDSPVSNKLKKVEAYYEIDTWGSNSDVYEFTLESVPNTTCVMIMLDSGKAMGLQCMEDMSDGVLSTCATGMADT